MLLCPVCGDNFITGNHTLLLDHVQITHPQSELYHIPKAKRSGGLPFLESARNNVLSSINELYRAYSTGDASLISQKLAEFQRVRLLHERETLRRHIYQSDRQFTDIIEQ